MIDSLRTYVTLVTGVTEATAAKAREVATALMDQSLGLARMTGADSVQALADDVLSASEANRAKLVELIRSEVDRAAARMGFVREDELAALRARVERLEKSGTPTPARSTSHPHAEDPSPGSKQAPSGSQPTPSQEPTVPKKRKIVVEEGT